MTMKRENGGYSPTGLRGMTSISLELAKMTETMPELGAPRRRGQILAAVKRGATVLDISEKSVFLLDQLMCFSQQQDWEAGRKPIVWPSNDLLADSLGLSKRAVQYRLQALLEGGLILAVDSPSGRRYGRRGPDKHIAEAFGFDLSPLMLRYEEFVAAGNHAAAMRKERGALRRRRTIAFKSVRMVVATALELGLDAIEWSRIGDQAEAIAGDARRTRSLPELRALVDRLDSLRADVEAHFQDQAQQLITSSEMEEIAPEGAKTFAPITTTTDLQFNKLNTVEGLASKKKRPQNSSSSRDTARIEPKRTDLLDPVEETITKYRIAPKLVAKLGGQWWRNFVPKDREIDWNDIEKIGAVTRKFIGVSDHAWNEGLRVCGPIISATLVAVIYAKSRHGAKKPITRSKGGYFRGMVAKAAAGELNLPPSIYALNDEINEQESQADGQ